MSGSPATTSKESSKESSKASNLSYEKVGDKPASVSPVSTPPSPPPVRVIQEIFHDYNDMGYKQSLRDLDTALDDASAVIIIEPMQLGDETARWIAVGNFLHKYTVVVGLTAAGGLLMFPRQWALVAPLGASSVLTFALYSLSWSPDPCVKYQVETGSEALEKLELSATSSASVVVIVRRDDGVRKLLHTSVTALLLGLAAYRALDHWLRP